MTDLNDELYSLLSATNDVTNIIGRRFYTFRAGQGTKPPYLVIEMPAHTVPSHLRGATNLENDIARFHLFGKDRSELRRLRTALIAMMDNPDAAGLSPPVDFTSVYRFGTELPEDDTQMYH